MHASWSHIEPNWYYHWTSTVINAYNSVSCVPRLGCVTYSDTIFQLHMSLSVRYTEYACIEELTEKLLQTWSDSYATGSQSRRTISD